MVVGTLSLVQKGQTCGCSGCNEIVVYGGGDIVFGAKRSKQWMQWNSGTWFWGHCLWCKKVKPVDAVDTVDTVNVVTKLGWGPTQCIESTQ